MPVRPEDQPLDTLREETVDRLITNYGHGHLSLEAFQRRLDGAFDAADHAALLALTRDLDLPLDDACAAARREHLTLTHDGPEQTPAPRVPEVEPGKDVEYLVHVFGGGDRSGEWTPPRELRIVTVFGGCDVDFSAARFTDRPTTIKLLCVFGGVNVYVPENANVTVNAFCLFGGVGNKARNHGSADGPRLVVEGLVLFGGADVKVRKTVRQRIQEFADSVRGAFSPAPATETRPPQSR